MNMKNDLNFVVQGEGRALAAMQAFMLGEALPALTLVLKARLPQHMP